MNKQRESVAVENNELRLKLKACLDEFDALEAQDKADNLTQQNESDNLTEGKKDSESATTEANEKEKVCMYVKCTYIYCQRNFHFYKFESIIIFDLK